MSNFDVAEQLQKFIDALIESENFSERTDYKSAFRDAQELAHAVMVSADYEGAAFDRLQRYVSDCLPWTEEVVKEWNRLERNLRIYKAKAGRE